MSMRTRNLIVYSILAALAAGCIAVAVIGFVLGEIPMGAIGVGFTCLLILAAAITYARGWVNARCDALYTAREYAAERAYIEKKMRGPLFSFVRIIALQHYIAVCLALDDLPTAKRYIERLRHGGGEGWKYRTAYGYILILLDEGNIEAARTEYEEFRTRCAQAEIYREQIEVLRAIFHRLLKTANTEPLPEAAVNSRYPVVGRILGRIIEARAAESGAQWEE